jgi:parvulin-like peptidyl-prolyl isomerase
MFSEVIMKSLLSAVVVASALIVPTVSFAQSNAPVTRAQVRAELVAAQQNGTLDQNDVAYPAAKPQFGATSQSSEVGGVTAGTSQSGSRPSVEQRIFSTFRGN